MTRGIKEIKNEIFKLILEYRAERYNESLRFEINGKISKLNAEIEAIRSVRGSKLKRS